LERLLGTALCAAALTLSLSCESSRPVGTQRAAILTGQPLIYSADQPGARFGRCLAGAGDVNGDGYDDLLIGSPYYETAFPFEGRAWFYLGGPDGPAEEPSWTSESNQAQARWGRVVDGAGDVDGDGYDDLFVAAHNWSGDQEGVGVIHLFHGTSDGPEATSSWVAQGTSQDAGLGWSGGRAGDVNGDGYADIVGGAWRHTETAAEQGAVYVWHGGPDGLSTTADFAAFGAEGEQLGFSVREAGDVNGDGYDDIVAGARFGADSGGEALLWLGGPNGLDPTVAWRTSGEHGSLHGWAVSSAGDTNNDGYDDLLVGEPGFSDVVEDGGRVMLHLGGPGGPSVAPDVVWEGESFEAQLGAAVGSAGDADGDGYDDVLLGAWQYAAGEFDEGGAWLYLGGPDGPDAESAWSGEGDQINAFFGLWVQGVGDLDGDGLSDIGIGAKGYITDQIDEGGAFIYLSTRLGEQGPTGDDDDSTENTGSLGPSTPSGACGCSAALSSVPGGAGFVLIALLGLRRRRRSGASATAVSPSSAVALRAR